MNLLMYITLRKLPKGTQTQYGVLRHYFKENERYIYIYIYIYNERLTTSHNNCFHHY